MATWDWLAANAERRQGSACALAGGAKHHHAGLELCAGSRSAGGAARIRSRGAISVYAQGLDYHDVIKAKLKRLAGQVQSLTGGGDQSFRRYRAGDGEAARGGGRHRLAGQAHQSRLARIRLLAVSRRDLHHRRDCRRTSREPTIAASAGAASTSARPTPSQRPTSSMRGAASPISPSSIRDISRASFARRWATASMAATIVSRSVPGTNSPPPRTRPSLRRGARRDNPPLAELARCSTTPASARASAGTAIKRTGRDRFLRNVLIAAGNSRDAACCPRSRRGSTISRRW